MSCASYLMSVQAEEMKYGAASVSDARRHAMLCLCMCVHMVVPVCAQASGALGVAVLADCCIIFGRASPSLWRASLRSAGSPSSPLWLRESGQAQPSRFAGCRSTQPGPAPTALRCTQMARLLIGIRAWQCQRCSASVSGCPAPPSENRHSDAVVYMM